MATQIETLQTILDTRLAEYAAMTAAPDYSDGQTSEARNALRMSLLREIEKLQAMIASPGAAGGVPWEVQSQTPW